MNRQGSAPFVWALSAHSYFRLRYKLIQNSRNSKLKLDILTDIGNQRLSTILFYIKGSLVTAVWRALHLQRGRATARALNKQSKPADKGWSSI
jgi:hypothetical protein